MGLWVRHGIDPYLPALRSLEVAGFDGEVWLGSDAGSTDDHAGSAYETPESFLRAILTAAPGHVAIMNRPCLVPRDVFANAARLLDDDLRIASVSFPSNAAGLLSVPHRGRPTNRAFDGHDEGSITALLRAGAHGYAGVPVPHADGALVVLSGHVIAALLDEVRSSSGRSMWSALADASLQARRRGFVNVMDRTTFVASPTDLDSEFPGTAPDRDWLMARHGFIAPLVTHEEACRDSALAIGLRSVRTTVEGIKVLIDGSCLGPHEMGTQVALVSLVQALVKLPEIKHVGVTLPGPVPEYARSILADSKVLLGPPDPVECAEMFGLFDVGHRPFQPDGHFDPEQWRAACDRVIVSVLDLIAYDVGSYQPTGEAWMAYRAIIESVMARVDAISVISRDVQRHVELQRSPIEPSRLFAVPLGTEHLTGAEECVQPRVFEDQSIAARPFMLCLGTNYAHKNRDLAITLRNDLQQAGIDMALVMAGASVPDGSSRISEARASVGVRVGDVVTLPDVTSTERNWLLRHASLLVYPTSAEGFGFVPFEAARFGTPSLAVSFGPIRELGADGVIAPVGWDREGFLDAARALLTDPAQALDHVKAILAKSDEYSWERCALAMVDMYRRTLEAPPRMGY